MTDVNGIPNYGFQGGQTGGVMGGNAATGQHAMSADEINRSMWGNYSPGQAQNTLNNIYGSQGFGYWPAYYAAQGAAYGRQIPTSAESAAAAAAQPPAQQHHPGSSWIDPTPGAGAGAGFYGNGFNPGAYLTSNPDVRDYALSHGMDPNLFAEEHAMGRGVIESRSGAEPFGNPFTWGNQAGGGNPFGPISQSQWYQGLGGDAFAAVGNPYEPLYQTPFTERLINPNPDIDFDERWGDRWQPGFDLPVSPPKIDVPPSRIFQQEYDKVLGGLTDPQRQRAGALESYFERNPDVWDAAKASGQGVLKFGKEHILAHGEDEGRELFNPVQYLNLNQDVRAAGMDPWTHYDRFGRDEGREQGAWGNVFNPDTYLMNNRDVANAGMDARTHYLKFGQYENRQGGGVVPGGDVFNRDVYNRLNPDVAAAGVDPLTHWQTFGRNEGRQGAGTVETDRDSVARTLLAREMAQQYGKSPTAAGAALTHPGAAANQPSSGYLGIQTPLHQDPFSGWRNPADMNAGGGFPANYQQGFYGQQGFTPFENQSGG